MIYYIANFDIVLSQQGQEGGIYVVRYFVCRFHAIYHIKTYSYKLHVFIRLLNTCKLSYGIVLEYNLDSSVCFLYYVFCYRKQTIYRRQTVLLKIIKKIQGFKVNVFALHFLSQCLKN